ncbi:hypothetical protein QYM36_006811 [Artemia franciscana]|uniref:Uncharacterized protein n=1 Tax=Artemia franciscana TaxID=6661 RepID=A0AA88L2E7_ARTSF|nr:hypothetical protein QYM36_006811 [Artemia franciscana]
MAWFRPRNAAKLTQHHIQWTRVKERTRIIGGSLFQHRDIHKYSWTSPDGITRYQIDHCLVNRKWRTSLMDVCSHRGADVGSDHNLMIAKFKVKLTKNVKHVPYSNPPFDSDKLLHSTVKRIFVIEFFTNSNHFPCQKSKPKRTVGSRKQLLPYGGDRNTGVKETP